MKKIILVIVGLLVSFALLAQTTTHVVKAGETIKSIAAKYKVTEKALIEANPGMSPNFLIVGITIKIPAPAKKTQAANTVTKKPTTSKGQTVTETQTVDKNRLTGQSAVKKETQSAESVVAESATKSAPPQTGQERSGYTTSEASSYSVSNERVKSNIQYRRGGHLSIAGGIPILGQAKDYYDSNWALLFGGDFDFGLGEGPAFLSVGTDFILNWQRPKNSKESVFVMENFFPVQVGVGGNGVNARAGGFLGWASSFSNDTAFVYGLKFNLQWYIDIGFVLVWTSGSSSPGKLLTIGIRF